MEYTENEIIAKAIDILDARLRARRESDQSLTSPVLVRQYLQLKIAALPHEVFCCLFLDTRHRVLCFEEMFRGTVDSASVYPREVVKRALTCNAAAVIFAHNHPSGLAQPSRADKVITERLREALATVDIRVLDHIIVGEGHYSFAEHGLI